MGVASITHNGNVFRFRTDPNTVRWNYRLNTSVQQTYGGRVVQLVSATIEDLTVTADAGLGGWDYIHRAALFFRNMMFDQRNGGKHGVLEYPPRGWKLGVYAVNFPFADDVAAVAREYTLTFKVQEDISGVLATSSLALEIAALKDGVGYEHNEYNTPAIDLDSPATDPPVTSGDQPPGPSAPVGDRRVGGGTFDNIPSPFVPM